MNKRTIIAFTTAQVALGSLIARHEDHAESPLAVATTNNMTGFIYPTTSSATYDPKSSSVGNNAPYYAMNATSTQGWAQYGSGLPEPSPSSFAPTPPAPTTTPWDGLWPMHWPKLHASDSIITATWTSDTLWPMHWPTLYMSSSSSMAASTSVVESNPSIPSKATTPTPAISILTALPNQPTQQSSTAIIIPMTTMPATFQGVHSGVGDESGQIQTQPSMPALDVAGILDPVYFGPTDTQTSTIHITVTASAPQSPSSTPTIQTQSWPREYTITSKVTSTLVKTVTLSSTTPHASPTSDPPQVVETSSTSASSNPAVHTTIISADPRCPYPVPGVYCGKPKTTLVTETKSGKTSLTSAPTSTGESKKPKPSLWCPYPGQVC